MIGEEAADAESQGVAVIETNIDDLNPQFYETAMERLFAAGALDVFLSPIQMKKNRPGTLLSVICDPAGRRRSRISFWPKPRPSASGSPAGNGSAWIAAGRRSETEFGTIRIKIGERNGRVITASPEYEDCKRAAAEHGVPLRRVHESALTVYRAGKGTF